MPKPSVVDTLAMRHLSQAALLLLPLVINRRRLLVALKPVLNLLPATLKLMRLTGLHMATTSILNSLKNGLNNSTVSITVLKAMLLLLFQLLVQSQVHSHHRLQLKLVISCYLIVFAEIHFHCVALLAIVN